MKKSGSRALFIYTIFVVFGFVSIYGIALAFIPPSSSPPTANPTETIGVSRGGTGLTSAGAIGNVLTSNGTVWASSPAASGVGGGGTLNYISKFTASGTVGNSQIFDNGTYIGIGTTTDFGSPDQYKLSMVGDNYTAASIRLKTANTVNPGTGSSINFVRARGTQASPTTVVADDVVGQLSYDAYDGTDYNRLGFINTQVDAVTGGIVSGKIVVYTTKTDGLYGNALTINDDQNVGIGTANPQGRLDISGGALAISGNVGSSGQVLTSQGAGVEPVWANVPVNVAKNKSITSAGFYTAPAPLSAIVDGNMTTAVTTVGASSALAAAGNIGWIIVDLGAVKLVDVSGLLAVWSTASSVQIMLGGSEDNVTYSSTGYVAAVRTSTVEGKVYVPKITMYARYVRFLFYLNGAGTGYVKPYEILAHEIKP